MFEYFIKAAPQFLLYFGTALAFTVAFLTAYTVFTPQNEFKLIRDGNIAATTSLLGAFLGFIIPLGTVIQHSVSIPDLAIWGLVVLIVQILAFTLARLVIPNLPQRIETNVPQAGLFAGGIALSVGLLNSACMVP